MQFSTGAPVLDDHALDDDVLDDEALDDDETLTAYHEAGHAVIAHVLGGSVDGLQLGGDIDDLLGDRFGDCRVIWGAVDPLCDWQRQREVLTLLAGPVAEMVYRGESLHPAGFGPWQDDWQRAWALCESFTPDSRSRIGFLERLLQQLSVEMQREPCWAAIAAIADELLAHESLDADQVAEILGFWIR